VAVQADFTQWGPQSLKAGQQVQFWYTWIFDGAHWSRMSALPVPDSPAGGSVQIIAEWATPGTLNVIWRNNGSDTVVFRPTVIVLPSRF
jgi:hypothetical protein